MILILNFLPPQEVEPPHNQPLLLVYGNTPLCGHYTDHGFWKAYDGNYYPMPDYYAVLELDKLRGTN